MTIRLQFEQIRTYMSLCADHREEEHAVKEKFGSDANHFMFPSIYHYRSFSGGFTPKALRQQFDKLDEENNTEWGKEPWIPYRTLRVDYAKINLLFGEEYECNCCDPGFLIVTDKNAHLIKVESKLIGPDEMLYSRRLYEYFRRAVIIDHNLSYVDSLNTEAANYYKDRLEKELEISNMFEDINNRFN